ncbi:MULTISPECIES: protein-L-isoaspartate(D-aspartate) O-methyltransferase [unclassified Sphingomonas]|jgi:protein-L-isoaspartate(D-aspartate) O-methyltransferase|uniref:protein-L-isoaspartate(D-aspartate) O-methyltransferase n=1 Tax=unclassified Sphingomonas TaxID=196159 RepID=UPI001E5460EE|nr:MULTISPECIES: protein-L-isoaspartate(D-aspartate) O-methyltransferase [unclassified Sphingomonas]
MRTASVVGAALLAPLAVMGATAVDGQRARPGLPELSKDGWVDLSLIQRITADHRSYAVKRRELVDGIRSEVRKVAPDVDDARFEGVLQLIGAIPREEFVSKEARQLAYFPTPLQIGYGQTISDAYIQAIMTAELRLPPNAEVLDVGTGSGYQAAILSGLARRVSSIEIVAPLAEQAAKRLHRLGYRNVEVRAGDGFAGWPEHAPFDGIVVAAGAAAVPQPLLDQLKPGGRLVMPIGPTGAQEQLLVYTKGPNGSITRCSLGWAMFVDLTGTGQRPADSRGLMDRSIPKCHAADVT